MKLYKRAMLCGFFVLVASPLATAAQSRITNGPIVVNEPDAIAERHNLGPAVVNEPPMAVTDRHNLGPVIINEPPKAVADRHSIQATQDQSLQLTAEQVLDLNQE